MADRRNPWADIRNPVGVQKREHEFSPRIHLKQRSFRRTGQVCSNSCACRMRNGHSMVFGYNPFHACKHDKAWTYGKMAMATDYRWACASTGVRIPDRG